MTLRVVKWHEMSGKHSWKTLKQKKRVGKSFSLQKNTRKHSASHGSMQSRGSWSPLSGISGTISSGSRWRVEPGTGNVRMSQCHKERTCRLTAMRRVGRCFVPVIFLANHCVPGDAFFFKWIFPGEAVRKILLKTDENAADRDTMIYLWWKGKTDLYLSCEK